MRVRTRWAVAGLVLPLVLTGCGTTVPVTQQVSAGGSTSGSTLAGDEPASAGLGAVPAGPGSPQAQPGRAVPGAPGAAISTTKPGRSITPGRTPGAAQVPLTGRGWTKDVVYVGVTTNQDVSTAANAVGVASLDSGDQKAEAEAAIAALNARGGLFGRRLVGIYLDIPTTQDSNTSAQAACSSFTQDNTVVAVVNGALENDNDNFRTCMAKAGVPVLALGGQPFDDKVFSDAKGYYGNVIAPSWNRLAPALVSALTDDGWFSGWDTNLGAPGTAAVKVGLLAQDNPRGRRVAALITRALAAKGHAPASTVYYASEGTSLQSEGLTALQSAVTRFRSDGVTHVISADQFLVFFQSAAESQRYRPRYGVNSLNAPSTLMASTAPAAQMAGASGLGYVPSLDVDAAQEPPMGEATAFCRAAMRRAGLNYSGKRFADGYSLAYCDALRLVVEAATAGGGLTGPQVLDGIERLGRSFSPASTFRSGLGRGARSLPGAGRVLRWTTGCGCFAYSGGLRTF